MSLEYDCGFSGDHIESKDGKVGLGETHMTGKLPRPKLSKTVERYFKAWLGPETWYTGHPNDMRRFYLFVKSVVRYNRVGHRPSEQGLQLLMQEYSIRLDAEYFEKLQREYSSLYANLLEYETAIEAFPDPLIEQRSPVLYYNRLLQLYGHDRESDIKEIMDRKWGNDWEKKAFGLR